MSARTGGTDRVSDPRAIIFVAALAGLLCGCMETIQEPYFYTVGWFRDVKIDDGTGTLAPRPDSQITHSMPYLGVSGDTSSPWFRRGRLAWNLDPNIIPAVGVVDTVNNDTIGHVFASCYSAARSTMVPDTVFRADWAVLRGLPFDSTLTVPFANSTESISSRGAISFELHSGCGRAVGAFYWVTVGGYTEKKSRRSLFGAWNPVM